MGILIYIEGIFAPIYVYELSEKDPFLGVTCTVVVARLGECREFLCCAICSLSVNVEACPAFMPDFHSS